MSSTSRPPADAPYRNASLSITERVANLLSQMTLLEKAGQLFHNMIPMGPNGSLSTSDNPLGLPSTDEYLNNKLMTHFNLIGGITDPKVAATWHNRLQEAARQTRLGIPVTVSTDPRNHFTDNVGTSFNAGCFSQWPETLGLAALRDAKLVQRFADIARQEYLAVGLRVALHPQIDLATEPRWARINATFGEDAELSGELGAAYIRGFQGTNGIVKDSVSCITKHFPGGGPEKDGEDSHFTYGKEQVYPGDNFDYHLIPFKKALEAGTSQVMPYYSQPIGLKIDGEKIEEVGFAFNKQIITNLLREKMGFNGIICTDWGLVTDANILGQNMPARAWGCEHLSPVERVAKILHAGCDQFGGESCPELVVEAVEKGLISEARIDESVRRLLEEKFKLGLFDDPFVDVEKAASIVGRQDFTREGEDAQQRAYTLLKNENDILPLHLDASAKIYTEGFDATLLTSRLPHITITNNPETADIALLRLKAPYTSRTGGFESFFHAGSLEYTPDEKARQAKIYKSTPTIVDLYLDRPACVPEVAEGASAVLCSYGASAEAFLDVLLGRAGPEGKLPFDLPRSMESVRGSREDVPFDTVDPVFRFGEGMRYKRG